MLTWLRVWPLLVLPVLLITLLASLPTFEHNESLLGGGPVREWLLNQALLPLLPDTQAFVLVGWFESASVPAEWLLALLIAVNINALLLLPLYAIGGGMIALSQWLTRTELHLKRRGVR